LPSNPSWLRSSLHRRRLRLVHPFHLYHSSLLLLLASAGTTKLFHSGDNQLLRALWTKAIQNFESFSLRFIVGDEEPLNLMQQVAIQIAQKTNVRVVARICGDGD
jgi:hypothetical protein